MADGIKALGDRRNTILAIGAILLLLIIAGLLFVLSHQINISRPPILASTETASAEIYAQLPSAPIIETSPGLVVYGTVTDQNGMGVENVNIYRSYASYAGLVIATTDANGDYASVFYPIPGDENVTIRAEKLGLSFEPENYHWRHYYGYEKLKCDFQIMAP
jgi:hypothetical protein